MEINLNNYEEYLLTYVDGELDEAASRKLMQFLNEHPDKKKELGLLQMTVLPVEKAIHFPDKKLLYREEKLSKKKVFTLRRYQWLSAAVAACIALLVIFYIHPWKNSLPANNSVALNKSMPSVQKPSNAISSVEDTVQSSVAVSREEKKNTTSSSVTAPYQEMKAKEKPVVKASTTTLVSNHWQGIAKNNTVTPTLPMLSSPDLPINDSIENTALAVVQMTIKHEDNPETKINNSSNTGTSKAHTTGKEEVNNKIVNTAETLAVTKHDIDSTITQKLNDINQKTSGFISHIAKNGIRIGKLTIAFND